MHGIVKAQARRPVTSLAMIVFMISEVPPKIDWTRLSRQSQHRAGEHRTRCSAGQGRATSGQREPRRSRGASLGGDHAPGDRLAASQLPESRRGPDDHAEPAAADIPAIDADVDSGELIAAQLPQILAMHDPGHGSQVRSRSRQPPRGNQDLGRGQHAHHTSMSTCDAR